MRLTILLFDGFTTLDIVGGYEVLANVPGIETEFMAEAKGLITADTRRLALLAYRTFDEIGSTDILYVPGGPGVTKALNEPALLDTIRRLHASSTWTIGICNGVELLGAAGIIDDKEVTTNWACRDRMAAYGAKVNTKRFHRDGKIVTGAGVSASIDASLFLTSLIAGEDMARTIQLGIEYYPEPPFGNGTPDQAPASAQALIRAYEQAGPQRIAALRPPF
jgi:transcriptional regulator GlxA family with amidase domain